MLRVKESMMFRRTWILLVVLSSVIVSVVYAQSDWRLWRKSDFLCFRIPEERHPELTSPLQRQDLPGEWKVRGMTGGRDECQKFLERSLLFEYETLQSDPAVLDIDTRLRVLSGQIWEEGTGPACPEGIQWFRTTTYLCLPQLVDPRIRQ